MKDKVDNIFWLLITCVPEWLHLAHWVCWRLGPREGDLLQFWIANVFAKTVHTHNMKKLTDVVDMAVVIWSLYTYNPQFLSVLFLIPFKQCILYIRIFCYIFCEIKVPIRTKANFMWNRSSHLKTLSEPNTRATWQLRLCLRSSRYEGQCSFDWIAALRLQLLNYWLFSKGDLWRLFLLPLHELHSQLWLWGQISVRIKI